jgi:hypothetical protein
MKGTAKGCEMVRVTVEDAKRLIREASPLEAFVNVYVSTDGGIEARREECRAPYLEADFPGLLQSLGIVPHHKWRPHITQYAGGNDYDDLQYTVTRDEAQSVAEAFGVSLDAAPAPSASAPAVAVPEPVAKPLQRQRHQETEILRVLREIGHDPHALPRNTSGRAGPKAATFERLGWRKEERGVFDKAWERLRQTRDIADA